MAAADTPSSPILVRYVGIHADPIGVNGDYFTVGNTGNDDIPLPQLMQSRNDTRIRFSRGAEGWRVTLADEQAFFINQQRTSGLSPIETGDVVRFSPGGLGLQFTLIQQQEESFAALAARHAPELLKRENSPTAPPPVQATVANTKAKATSPSPVQQRLRQLTTKFTSSTSGWITLLALGMTVALLIGYLLGSLRG